MTKKPVSKSKSIKSDQHLRIQELERQLEIEAALERVRARTMAMHKSEDLEEVVGVLYEQVGLLELVDTGCNINIFNEAETTIESWMAGFDGLTLPRAYKIKGIHHPIIQKQWEFWQSKEDFLHLSPTGKEYNDFVKYIINETELSLIPEDFKAQMLAASEVKFFFVNMKCGQIEIVNSVKITEETIAVVGRFAQVFEQTYTRFLDLQKAEAQVREAQIEAALERVRSKAMAMHSSEDLATTVDTFFSELNALNVLPRRCGVGIVDAETRLVDIHATTATEDNEVKKMTGNLTLKGHPVLEGIYDHWKALKEYHPVLRGKEISAYYKAMNPEVVFPDFADDVVQYGYYFHFKEGGVFAWTDKELVESELQIFRRYTSVLSLTYRRYMDLKEAEAQTREAQIEAAVERVRSRALAMHNSIEILEVAVTLKREMVGLGLDGVTAATIYLKQKNGKLRLWDLTEVIESRDGPYLSLDFEFGLDEIDPKLFINEIWNNNEQYYIVEMETDGLERCIAFLQKFAPETVPDYKEFLTSNQVKHSWHPVVPIVNGRGRLNLDFILPPPKEIELILPKMGAAFDLAYKRFVDLENAETQAREAQIEVALERVRSASMAMHKSEELANVASTLFVQLNALGGSIKGAGLAFCAIDDPIGKYWMSNTDSVMLPPIFFPHKNDPTHVELYNAWKRKEPIFVVSKKGKALEKHYQNMMAEPSFKEEIELAKKEGFTIADRQTWNTAYFSNGYLLIVSKEAYEYPQVLARFAKVFEQSYTRFLDLQKAEAQTREAQIEAALERVRAASMAMHQSEDLFDVVTLVFDQLSLQGIQIDSSMIIENHEDSKDWVVWAAAGGQNYSDQHRVPYLKHDLYDRLESARRKGLKFLEDSFTKAQKDEWFTQIFTNSTLVDVPDDRKNYIYEKEGLSRSVVLTKNVSFTFFRYSLQSFSDKENDLFKRFAGVFEQAYARFLDLQKAAAQAREAEIEAALERVRAATMAMHQSHELAKVVGVLYEQVKELELVDTGCNINIFHEEEETIESWMAGFDNRTLPRSYRIQGKSNSLIQQQWESWHGQDHFLFLSPTGKDYNDFVKYILEETELRLIPDDYKELMQHADEVHFAYANMKYGHIEVVSNERQTEDSLSTVRRFAKVFERTYTRFLDLQKAESQTREALIETALERVRAASMAMHNSNDLHKVIVAVYNQMEALGLKLNSTQIAVSIQDEKVMHLWNAANGQIYPKLIHLPFTRNIFFTRFRTALKNRESFYSVTTTKKQKDSLFRHYFNNSSHLDVPKSRQDSILSTSGMVFSVAVGKNIVLSVMRYNTTPFSNGENEIIIRIAKVFEQTYTRFLDLQKAEAQAREAQIEAALERVRAASMAMHKSQDIMQVAEELRTQMSLLGQPELESCIIHIYPEGQDYFEGWWVYESTRGDIKKKVKGKGVVPYKLSRWSTEVYKHYKSSRSEYTIKSSGKMLTEWYNLLVDLAPETVEYDANNKLIIPDVLYYHFSKFSGGALLVISEDPPSEHIKSLQKRASNVFNLAHGRFLDLQKAEAQAREAQIEAALERVRAATMAMHNSEDVGNTVSLMFDQLDKLNISTMRCGLGICLEHYRMEVWTAKANTAQRVEKIVGYLDMKIHELLKGVYDAWKEGKKYSEYDLKGKDLIKYFKALNEAPEYPINFDLASLPTQQFHSNFTFQEGVLYVFTKEPLSLDDQQVFTRFAGVFGQTYRRYLDLQKAEAQAKEAQIETALERVRAASMAMHESDDLLKVVKTVFEQLKLVGIHPDACLLHEFTTGDNDDYFWVAAGGQDYVDKVHLPYIRHPYFSRLKKAKSQKLSTFQDTLTKKQKDDFFSHYFTIGSHKTVPKKRKAYIYSAPALNRSTALFKNTALTMMAYTTKPFTSEENDVFQRFAYVFEQSYTRFLDLQKAEAQAREAQIEASLERVRSRTMAMHHSDELIEAATVMYQELIALGFDQVMSGGYGIMDEDNNVQNCWFAQTDNDFLVKFTLPLKGDKIMNERYELWKKQENTFKQVLKGKRLKAHMEFTFPSASLSDEERIANAGMPDPTYFYFGNFAEGWIILLANNDLSDEQESILARFSQSFSMTYTRFLDLQKAEAQAREAQIEASLEKVRGSSMAMHESEDLIHVANVMNQEFEKLGFTNSLQASFVLIDEEKKVQYLWGAQTDSRLLEYVTLPLLGDDVLQDRYGAWKRKEAVLSVALTGEKRKMHLDVAMPLESLSERQKKGREAIPDPFHICCGFIKYGYLTIISSDALADDQQRILARMAKVFEQTYTRFLDLQKAEAQTREAEIETALERLRSRSMAMHDSEELGDVANLLYKELIDLGVSNFFNCGFIIVKEEEGEQYGWLTQPEGNFEEKLNLPYPGDIVLKNRLKAWKAKEPVFFQKVGGKTLTRHLKYVADRSHSQHQVEKIIPFMPDPTYFYCGNFDHGYLHLITGEELGQKAEDILVRFSKVFNQTYTRFLDLQKAEVQAREALIEAALERVRARAMGMHHSSELAETSTILFEQLSALGLVARRCGFALIREGGKIIEIWSTIRNANKEAELLSGSLYEDQHPMLAEVVGAWRRKEASFRFEHHGEELQKYYNALDKTLAFPKKYKDEVLSKNKSEYNQLYNFDHGFIYAFTESALSDDEHYIMERFTQAFDLTYRRFLDLTQAEAQAREAQIEAALEKVRSSMMAMHKSDELRKVVGSIFTQLQVLGFESEACALIIYNSDYAAEHWLTGFTHDTYPRSYKIPYVDNPYFTDFLNAWKKGVPFQEFIMEGKPKTTYAKWALEHSELKHLPDEFKKEMINPERLNFADAFMRYGMIEIMGRERLPAEKVSVLKRFAKVFEQTYTRFLDLQKAEAQTREAQIETALERVRARAMAMHNSNELSGAAELLYSEFLKLGVKPFSIGYVINDEKAKQWKIWMTDANDEKFKDYWTLPFNADRHLKNRYDSWKRKDDFHFTLLEGKENIKHHEVIAKYAPWKVDSLKDLPHRLVLNSAHFLQGHLLIVTGDLLSAYEEKLLCRFAKVFEQTYTRFLDLKKAEERAQEAEIEASMERVRSRAMAMHKTEDLNEVIAVIFEELKHLGFENTLCSIGIYDSETKGADWWSFIEDHDIPGAYHFPYLEGRWFREVYQAWVDQKPFHYIELRGAEYKDLTQLTFEKTDWKNLPQKIKNKLLELDGGEMKSSYVSMSRGMLEIATDGPLNTEQIEVLQRFTKVIDLTYTRVDDLEQAEAREKEATQQASLDRIRAEISSMRNTDDLMRITPLIWKELNVVDIPFFRCGIFIMDEGAETVQVFLANAEGEALTTLNLSFGSAANIDLMVDHWRDQKNYIDSWDQKQYISFFTSMMEQGHMSYQEMLENPPEQLHLQFVPFKQGMLYIGSLEKLNTEQLGIVGAMAQTFQSAYNRYEDFRKIEFAKIEVEKTLGDLKSAQNQLIHAEKMASLGELTAGIAHEIQNPLNFVNNFSDVSGEMIDEAFEELDSNDVDEAKDILKDLKGNLEKIAHHGRRASSIVKGMLDHSRTDNSQKVETDINALCDEYLRLSYHGLRAKDNSFNSAYEMKFDESLPKIKVIPQELGRVLLNILNNAFYACATRSVGTSADRSVSTSSSKSKANTQPTDASVSTGLAPSRQVRESKGDPALQNYKPLVTLTTKQLNDSTIIIISDNGIGMSEETLDKVFQPFFTTKPTGEGTGLGMSISYDIITKGHGGEMKVESKEGEGTTFRIEIPSNKN